MAGRLNLLLSIFIIAVRVRSRGLSLDQTFLAVSTLNCAVLWVRRGRGRSVLAPLSLVQKRATAAMGIGGNSGGEGGSGGGDSLPDKSVGNTPAKRTEGDDR